MANLKENFEDLKTLLVKYNETEYAEYIQKILLLNEESNEFRNSVNSNLLWGGSGSIADQALCNSDVENNDVFLFNQLIVNIGSLLEKEELSGNSRISVWVEFYKMQIKKKRKKWFIF